MRRGVVILAVLFTCRGSFGAALVGPSTAVLDGESFGVSAEYSQMDADIDFEGVGPAEDFDFHTGYVDFTAALTQRWDFYVRPGASQAEADGFDGETDFSWGMGTRFTVFTSHDVSWGALAQLTNLNSQQDIVDEFLIDSEPVLLEAEEELNLVEYLFATGPTWQHDRLALYGGLLVRYVTGELETDAGIAEGQLEVDAQWDVGGYVGGRYTLFRARTPAYGLTRGDLTAEGRFTGDSSGFSIGLLLPFGGPVNEPWFRDTAGGL